MFNDDYTLLVDTTKFVRKHYTFSEMVNRSTGKNDFGFLINFSCINGDIVEHDHNFAEMVIVLDGTATHCINGIEYHIGTGDVFAITGCTKHNYTNCKDFKHCNIMFNIEKLVEYRHEFKKLMGFQALFYIQPSTANNSIKKMTLNIEQLQIVNNLLQIIQNELINKFYDYEEVVCNYYLSVLYFICRAFSLDVNTNLNKDELFAHSVAYIEQNFHKKITLKELANIAAMSERHYERTFKNIFFVTTTEYINKLRMDLAKSLLKRKELSTESVAEKCGFYDSSAFCKRFKKYYNITPLQYRQQTLTNIQEKI